MSERNAIELIRAALRADERVPGGNAGPLHALAAVDALYQAAKEITERVEAVAPEWFADPNSPHRTLAAAVSRVEGKA